jgi:outer membrane biosynthesis protein TonB
LAGFIGLVAALLLAGTSLAQPAPVASAPAPADRSVVTLPKVTVVGEALKDYPLFARNEVTPAGFSDRSAPIRLYYPGEAASAGVGEGSATVGVALDSKGLPTDFLLLRYTRRYFGDALLREARRQQFAPRMIKGVAVPGRFAFSYRFTPEMDLSLNNFEAIEEREMEIEGGPRFVYEPHLEREIDNGGLQMTKATVALIPDGYSPPNGRTVKALASFYVDETGHARLPSVESAPSPLLIPNAVKAVEHWEFKPPTLNGKPVLVFAIWTVGFEPLVPAHAPSAPGGRP